MAEDAGQIGITLFPCAGAEGSSRIIFAAAQFGVQGAHVRQGGVDVFVAGSIAACDVREGFRRVSYSKGRGSTWPALRPGLGGSA